MKIVLEVDIDKIPFAKAVFDTVQSLLDNARGAVPPMADIRSIFAHYPNESFIMLAEGLLSDTAPGTDNVNMRVLLTKSPFDRTNHSRKQAERYDLDVEDKQVIVESHPE